MQGERHAPNHSAIELAANHARIDDPSRSECTHHAGNAHLSEIGINPDLGEYGPMRIHRVGRLRGRIGGAPSLSLDLQKPGPAENVGVALAAVLVVAAKQAAVPGDHAGISSAEKRRAIV